MKNVKPNVKTGTNLVYKQRAIQKFTVAAVLIVFLRSYFDFVQL